jgi:hypothetical protein
MVEGEDLGMLAGRALVHGHDPRAVQHLHGHRRQPHGHASGGIPGGD